MEWEFKHNGTLSIETDAFGEDEAFFTKVYLYANGSNLEDLVSEYLDADWRDSEVLVLAKKGEIRICTKTKDSETKAT